MNSNRAENGAQKLSATYWSGTVRRDVQKGSIELFSKRQNADYQNTKQHFGKAF